MEGGDQIMIDMSGTKVMIMMGAKETVVAGTVAAFGAAMTLF